MLAENKHLRLRFVDISTKSWRTPSTLQHCIYHLSNIHKTGRNSDFVRLSIRPIFLANDNKLTKLGDAIAISKSETINDPLTHWPTDRGRCWEMLSHLTHLNTKTNTHKYQKIDRVRKCKGRHSSHNLYVKIHHNKHLHKIKSKSNILFNYNF